MIESETTSGAMHWSDPQLWYFIGVFVMALLARHLVSSEPLDKRRLAGEAILSAIGAIVFWSAGLLQGMSTLQMVFFGSLAALGGVRAVEWGIKIAAAVKNIPTLPR